MYEAFSRSKEYNHERMVAFLIARRGTTPERYLHQGFIIRTEGSAGCFFDIAMGGPMNCYIVMAAAAEGRTLSMDEIRTRADALRRSIDEAKAS